MRLVAMLGLAIVGMSYALRTFATPCPPPQVMTEATPAGIRDFFAAHGWQVVTFLGYSGAGYENVGEMLRHATDVLSELDPDQTIVNIGATEEGIGAIYKEAKRLGFKTSGIVSTQAKEHGVALSPCVDYVFFVEDSTWGGYLSGGKTLSPTSSTIVTVSDVMIAIGGGDVARDELLEARRQGKRVVFIPADMNHRLARDKATKKGEPEPLNFRGSLHEAWVGESP